MWVGPPPQGQEVNPPYGTAAQSRALELEGLGSHPACVLSCCGALGWKVPLSEPQFPLCDTGRCQDEGSGRIHVAGGGKALPFALLGVGPGLPARDPRTVRRPDKAKGYLGGWPGHQHRHNRGGDGVGLAAPGVMLGAPGRRDQESRQEGRLGVPGSGQSRGKGSFARTTPGSSVNLDRPQAQ